MSEVADWDDPARQVSRLDVRDVEVAGKPAVTQQIIGVINGRAIQVFNPTYGDSIAEGDRRPQRGTPIQNSLTAEKPKHCRDRNR